MGNLSRFYWSEATRTIVFKVDPDHIHHVNQNKKQSEQGNRDGENDGDGYPDQLEQDPYEYQLK